MTPSSSRRAMALAALSLACGQPAPSEPAPDAPTEAAPSAPAAELPDPSTLPDVLLITMDTTRADRLGAYGYDKALTDTLDGLAASGRIYKRAYSPLPLTIPSHATMFTGVYPPTHGVRSNSDQVLKPSAVTLAERLKEAGYRTGASVSAFVTTRRFGFDQGFDVYFDDVEIGRDQWHSERPADDVIGDMLAWDALKDDSMPRFGWVHLYDAHFPYKSWPAYIEKTENRPYDAELARLDDQIATLLDGFSKRPTIVVVIGDHGEGLGEHNELAHGMQVYSSTQHVPWFMAGPGIEAGEVVDDAVTIADLTPTLLDLLGLPPLDNVHGVVAPSANHPAVYMETYEARGRFGLAPSVAVVDGALKLIDLPKPELYDLVVDPGETNNLAEAQPDDVVRLRKHLEAWDFPAPAGTQADVVDADLQSQLAALGYVSGSQPLADGTVLPDPKDHVDMFVKSQRADRLARQNKPDEQRAVLAELVEDYPDVVEFRSRLVRALVRAEALDAAQEVVDEGVRRFPESARMLTEQGTIYAAQKRFGEASTAFQKAVEFESSMPRLRVLAVICLQQSGDMPGALRLASDYMEAHPNDYNLAGWVGLQLVKIGRFAEAKQYLENGILADVPERDVAFHLAAAATGRKDRMGAVLLLEKEVKHHPTNLQALTSLGRLLLGMREPQRALDAVEATLTRLPDAQALWYIKAQALFNLQRLADARVALDAGMAAGEPVLSDLLMLQANLLQQEGKPEDAQVAYQAALDRRKAEQAPTEAPSAPSP